jgi:hypothetical protein
MHKDQAWDKDANIADNGACSIGKEALMAVSEPKYTATAEKEDAYQPDSEIE